MGLFGKDKENNDSAQMNDVKQATTSPPPFEPPKTSETNNTAPPLGDLPSSSQQNFQNPFSQNGQPTSIDNHENPFTGQYVGQPSGNTMSMNQPQNMPNDIGQRLESNQVTYNEDEIQEMIDETVEKIIDERWEKLTSSVEKVVKWKADVEREIGVIKEDIGLIKEGFEKFEKRVLNKVSSYDKDILDVNSEIKALEKVFQKITPTLVNNVNELSRIANDLKGTKTDSNSTERK